MTKPCPHTHMTNVVPIPVQAYGTMAPAEGECVECGEENVFVMTLRNIHITMTQMDKRAAKNLDPCNCSSCNLVRDMRTGSIPFPHA